MPEATNALLFELMQKGFAEMREGFAQLREELDAVKGDIAVLKSDVASLKMDTGLIKDQGTYVTVRLEYLSRSVTDIAKLIAPAPASAT
jgi:hypothetical protein